MIEAKFEDIAVRGDGSEIMVLLRTQNDDILPISIDSLQAMSIAAGRAKEKFSRPLTHDLMLSLLELFDAKIKRIEITELRDNTFYARLILDNRGIEYDIDARPSDALALAVRSDVPLFVSEQVIEAAALSEMGGGTDGVEA